MMPQGSNDQSFAMTSSFSCMMLSAALLLGPASLEAARRRSTPWCSAAAHCAKRCSRR
ncbi:hypothetical protein M8494_09575 [Serratia ureilytica]